MRHGYGRQRKPFVPRIFMCVRANAFSVIVLLSLALPGCAKDNVLTAYLAQHDLKLSESVPEYSSSAIEQVNLILRSADSPLRVQQTLTIQCATSLPSSEIPVLWVESSSQQSDVDEALVPPKTRCVLLHKRGIGGFIYRYATERKQLGLGDVPIKIGEPSDVLALILLHEVAHIQLGHSGSFQSPKYSSDMDDRVYLNPRKLLEVDADRQAARYILSAGRVSGPAAMASRALQSVASRFAFQQQVVRSERYPPMHIPSHWRRDRNDTPYGDRRIVFGDNDFTHPNLEVRMRTIGYFANPTDASRASLLAYLRDRGDDEYIRILRLAPDESTRPDEADALRH